MPFSIIRFVASATTVSVLLAPVSALAATPFAIWHDGKSKSFDTTLYAVAAETVVTARLSGEYEGRDTKTLKAKFNADIRLQRQENEAHVSLKGVLLGTYAYVFVESVNGYITDDATLLGLSRMTGQWQKLPINPVWLDLLAPFSFNEFMGGMQYHKTRLADGFSYEISSLESARNWLPAYLRYLSYGFLPYLSADAKSSLRMKVDTTSDAEFRYARFWLGIDHSLAQIMFRFSGTIERQFHPVYVSVPGNVREIDTLQQFVPIDWFSLPKPLVTIDETPPPSRLYPQPSAAGSTGSAGNYGTSSSSTTPYFSLPANIRSIFRTPNYIPSYADEYLEYRARSIQSQPATTVKTPVTTVAPSRYGIVPTAVEKPSRRQLQRSTARQRFREVQRY